MAIRFQKRVTLFPGVRLNFSARGVSTTIGPRGFGVTLGGRGGPALNLGLPGTGLSTRVPLGGGARRRAAGEPDAGRHAPPPAGPGSAIESAPVDSITSEGLGELRNLIVQATEARAEALAALSAAQAERELAARRLRRAEHWFLGLFLGSRIPERRARLDSASARVEELEARRDGSFVDADFDVGEAALERFAELERAFESLCAAERIWDVTGRASVDRAATRSSASEAVSRVEVRFGFREDAVVQSAARVPCLRNANGADLLLYPGFVLMRAGSDVGLIDLRDVLLDFAPARFVEEGAVPADATIAGTAWARSNKDGSRDRRYRDNRELPVAAYGGLRIEASSGLRERYLVSDHDAALRFAGAFRAYVQALAAHGERMGA